MNEIQLHRGADTGYRNSNSQLRRDCEQITRMRYRWTLDNQPIGCTPSRKHWTTPWELRRKLLYVNVRFASNGRRIQVI